MRRREFLVTMCGAAAAWPKAAHSQSTERMRRVGLLLPFYESDAQARSEVAAFQGALQQLGWMEGRNLRIELRWAGGTVKQIQTHAEELVALAPDVLVPRTTPATAALHQMTRTIPIVFIGASDPVGSGFAASIARPDGNVTGFTNSEASLGGKWVEILKEINPRISRIAVIFDPNTSPGRGLFYLQLVQNAAKSVGLEALATPVHDAASIEQAVEKFANEPNGGLLVQPDVTIHTNRALVISLAARHRLPAVYTFGFYVAEGGLASYGVDSVDLHRRAASYVDRILRGEKPGQLAVQAPIKFELAINLKTAKALGLALPPTLIGRADAVIE
jgi:putative tryptophan/tyrosine transport system substrate-binding protein